MGNIMSTKEIEVLDLHDEIYSVGEYPNDVTWAFGTQAAPLTSQLS